MDRREKILEYLDRTRGPVIGSELARAMGVSRQVIVQDIAVLRAQGREILATPQGYLRLRPGTLGRKKAVLAVSHPPEQTRVELSILVDLGLKVIDVVVEHPIYGELRGYLMLESRLDVERFLERTAAARAGLLSTLTGGLHLHTVEYNREEDLARAHSQLEAKGILVKGN